MRFPLFYFYLRQLTGNVMNKEKIMTDPIPIRKWFCRAALALLVISVCFVVFRQSYNFAHWVPHNFLRSIGLSYASLLYFERHADKLLHIVVAFTLTKLMIYAEIQSISRPKHRALILVIAVLILVEIIQWQIGRGFEVTDAALGIISSYWAYRLAK